MKQDKMLLAVCETAPEVFDFVNAAYDHTSFLFCGDHTLESAEEVQQGDPLGPLLFYLTIQPLLLQLQSAFSVFYLDDGTTGGSAKDILHDLRIVEFEARLAGLELNHAKIELVCDYVVTCNIVLCAFSEFKLYCDRAILLVTPIGSVGLIDSILVLKVDKLKIIGERLQHLSSQDAFLILRNLMAILKVLYTLRTASCYLSDHLNTFDDALRSILSNVLNINLSNEQAWLQASLPAHAGGLGVRRAAQLAPSAYLASAASSSTLVHQIIPSSCNSTDPNLESAISSWNQGLSVPPPSSPNSTCQCAWDEPHVNTTHTMLLDLVQDQQARARLLAVSCAESGAWLNALPIAPLGLRLSDDVVRVAVGLRLGVPICRCHLCASCGANVEALGAHGLSCRFSKGRHSMHAALNDIVKRTLESTKIPCHLELSGLFRSNGKRPNGATIVPWKGGKVLIWDATCPDTLAPSHLRLAVREARVVADDAKFRKTQKYCNSRILSLLCPAHSGVIGDV